MTECVLRSVKCVSQLLLFGYKPVSFVGKRASPSRPLGNDLLCCSYSSNLLRRERNTAQFVICNQAHTANQPSYVFHMSSKALRHDDDIDARWQVIRKMGFATKLLLTLRQRKWNSCNPKGTVAPCIRVQGPPLNSDAVLAVKN